MGKTKALLDDAARATFCTVKQKLMEASVLCLADFSLPVILKADASASGLGAILSEQLTRGYKAIVANASRSLQ